MIGTKNSGINELLNHNLDARPFKEISFTHGFELGVKTVHLEERVCRLQCWVIQAENLLRHFRLFYPQYLRGTHGALLMANLADSNCFTPLLEWISLIRQNCNLIPILLVGNRPKLEKERQTLDQGGIQFAQEHNLAEYMEISTHTGFNMSFIFEKITSLMLEHYNR